MYIEVAEVMKSVTKNNAEGAAAAKTLMTKANTQTFE